MTNTTANEKYNSNEKKVLIWLWTDADAEFLTPQLFNFVSAAELILRHILSESDISQSRCTSAILHINGCFHLMIISRFAYSLIQK